MEQQPGEGRLAATAFADDAERLALAHGERDAVDRLHRFAARALDREVFAQIRRDQQRLSWAAPIAWIEGAWIGGAWVEFGGVCHRYIRTSIAARHPSLTRLNEIDVTKIAAPGSAQTRGTT